MTLSLKETRRGANSHMFELEERVFGGAPESDWRLNGIPSEKYRYLYFNEKR